MAKFKLRARWNAFPGIKPGATVDSAGMAEGLIKHGLEQRHIEALPKPKVKAPVKKKSVKVKQAKAPVKNAGEKDNAASTGKAPEKP
ncbi:hypothetical protein LCGC14_1605950 [marine sediment metagenome]|uniref:Uncharacterized protein n=1 Tax=marine sediment metagenome TaxID=412755 RepID=A0A0F9I9R7_9ZZZZ